MKVRRSTMNRAFSLFGALALSCLPGSAAPAPEARQQHHVGPSDKKPSDKKPSGDLVEAVRESTRRFRDVKVAEAEGYSLLFGCVTGPDWGAMGLHYVNLSLVGDDQLDPARPEIVIYEPQPDGSLRLIGADFLVFADTWHATNSATPELMGQLLHLFESPNRFGLPDFYTLHVWAWKHNPNGTFVNWHPQVSCDTYGGQTP